MLYDLLKKKNYRPVALQKNITGHFELIVSINGIDTNFIVDTGAARTVIDLAFARKLGLELQDTDIFGGGLGSSKMMLYRVKATKLLISELPLLIPEVYAIDMRNVRRLLADRGVTKPANGVIGADILMHHQAIIDYPHQLLYLKKVYKMAAMD